MKGTAHGGLSTIVVEELGPLSLLRRLVRDRDWPAKRAGTKT